MAFLISIREHKKTSRNHASFVSKLWSCIRHEGEQNHSQPGLFENSTIKNFTCDKLGMGNTQIKRHKKTLKRSSTN